MNVQRSALALAIVLVWSSSAAAMPATGPSEASTPGRTTTCDLIESAAAANGLPVEYFTRLLWKESNFRAGAVSHKGAQGIAQFMPTTAAERGLADPFDPYQAIPASAQLLSALAERFGNLGLAAAAYNSGPRRVDDWLTGVGGLPRETRNYVAAITGRPVEDWKALRDFEGEAAGRLQAAEPTTCLDVLASLNAPPQTAALAAPSAGAEWQPWGVQVAANFSEAQALATYRRLQQRHPALLAEQAPLIVRKRNLSFGRHPIVHIRIPAPTRQAANDFCGRLRDNGGNCVVLKN